MEHSKEIDLAEFGRNIIKYKTSPSKLDEFQLTLAGWYAYYSEQMIELELQEASFWEAHKDFKSEKPKSDPYVRALWKISKDGRRMLEVERTLSTIHILISSLKASLNRQTVERSNQIK